MNTDWDAFCSPCRSQTSPQIYYTYQNSDGRIPGPHAKIAIHSFGIFFSCFPDLASLHDRHLAMGKQILYFGNEKDVHFDSVNKIMLLAISSLKLLHQKSQILAAMPT